jgi:DNA-binding transcriptional MerR regulator
VNSLVDAAGIKPTNTSARAVLTARGVRFYVASGLVDRPEGTGTAATYNYRHLLQLVAIKIRQREGLTLDVIKTEMKDVTGDAMERRVATSLASALGAGAWTPTTDSEGEPASWRRVVVADGVELHVRDDVSVAREDRVIAMRDSLRAAISASGS